ncbi:MAG: DUF1573 domain-containing protein [Planctomycetaceae bacterium]
MNIRAVAVVVFLVLTGGGLAVHFRQQSVVPDDTKVVKVDTSDVPQPPKTGPYGKFVVVGETSYHFGVMEHLQKGEHEFKVRNDGKAPLKMVALERDQTCSCTLGSLGKDGLQPGEETNVKLSWTIKYPKTAFHHSAKIRTDDPENPVTTFYVRGFVGHRLVVKPSQEISVGSLSEKEPTERKIFLFSEVVDAFEITKFEPSNPLIVAKATPLTAEALKLATQDPVAAKSREMMKQMSEDAKRNAPGGKIAELPGPSHDQPPEDLSDQSPDPKCGYELQITLHPGFPIGKLRESLLIHTNVPSSSEADAPVSPPMLVTFTGLRSGPVQILGTPGITWSPEETLLRMGRFPAKEGKKAKLVVLVKKSEQELEITEAKLDPPQMKYEFRKDATFNGAGRDKFELVLDVPAGGIPLSLGGGQRTGSVILQTNHPEAKTIKFELEFTSF